VNELSEQSNRPESAQPSAAGVVRVDAILATLTALEDRPVDDHVELFEAAHAVLRDVLSGPDRGELEGASDATGPV
jgi:hypothetical protein